MSINLALYSFFRFNPCKGLGSVPIASLGALRLFGGVSIPVRVWGRFRSGAIGSGKSFTRFNPCKGLGSVPMLLLLGLALLLTCFNPCKGLGSVPIRDRSTLPVLNYCFNPCKGLGSVPIPLNLAFSSLLFLFQSL